MARSYKLNITPFSYDQVLTLAKEMTQAQQALEDKYGILNEGASKLYQYIDPDKDQELLQLYNEYVEDLNTGAQSLMNTGMQGPQSRSLLYSLNSRYHRELAPIEAAFNRRQAEIAEQQKMSEQDDSTIYTYDPSQRALKEYMKPSSKYRNLSLKKIKDATALTAETLAESFTTSDLRETKGASQFYTDNNIKGLTPQDIVDYTNGTLDKSSPKYKALQGIFDNALDMIGNMNDWSDPQIKQINGAILQGLYGAIGKHNINYITDQAEMTRLQGSINESLNRNEANRRKMENYIQLSTGIYYNVATGTFHRTIGGATTRPTPQEIAEANGQSATIAYGGPIFRSNKFGNGGQTNGAPMTMQEKMANLTPEEKEYLEKEKQVMSTLGAKQYGQYIINGYTKGQWDVYHGKVQEEATKKLERYKTEGRAAWSPVFVQSWRDDTSKGVDQEGDMSDVSSDDNEIQLIWDGSAPEGSQSIAHDEISLSPAFWESFNTIMNKTKNKYQYYDTQGVVHDAVMGRNQVRIYVDQDNASDNHFIIVPVDNDPFVNDPEYSRRVSNRLGKKKAGNSNAGIK